MQSSVSSAHAGHSETIRGGYQPKVSIGLPVYNGQDHLAAAIENILQQTYQAWELIISDNASTDGTAAIYQKYAEQDRRIRYYRSDTNRGLAWNFNQVVARARGEYFKWAAYDDLADTDLIKRCVAILDHHPDVIWCHSQTSYIDIRGEKIACKPIGFLEPVRHSNKNPDTTLTDQEPCPRIPWTRSASKAYQRFFAVMTGPGEVYDIYGVIRREAMLKTGLHRPFYGADRIFLAELSLLGRYAEIPEVLFFARRHANQTVFGKRADIERQTSGQTAQLWLTPLRIRNAWWMFRIPFQSPISWLECMQCLSMWCLFLLNPNKWNRLRLELLRRFGFNVSLPEDHIRNVALSSKSHKPEQ